MRFQWVLFAAVVGCSGDAALPAPPSSQSAPCDTGNGDITLPAGFCATVFADQVGAARHIVAAPGGDVYVALSGGGVLALRDTNADGRADLRSTFGRANSGLFLRGTDLFVDGGSVIVRYRLAAGTLAPVAGPDTVVRAIPTGGHGSRSIAVDANGNLFVNVGSATNICESSTRDPCGELSTRAGIWRFNAGGSGQVFSPAARFATGIRNAVGMAIHPTTGRLFVTQHGRDGLYQGYPSLFSSQDGAENPAEELFQVDQGDDFGWPYCYYDFRAGRRVLGPEYGGNRATIGRCSTTRASLVAFPGHWAPNGLVFYDGQSYPPRYRNGAFVAFHGSWNRAPQPQAGYLVAFVPANGASLGAAYEVFADGFTGRSTPLTSESQAAHRPTGLAVDPAGALLITDDARGRIWRVVYRGY